MEGIIVAKGANGSYIKLTNDTLYFVDHYGNEINLNDTQLAYKQNSPSYDELYNHWLKTKGSPKDNLVAQQDSKQDAWQTMNNREVLEDLGYENLIIFENPDYDDAIIGVSHDDRVVYDYDKMVEYLMGDENMTPEEAADFISYNTIRALPYAGKNAPIVMFGLEI